MLKYFTTALLISLTLLTSSCRQQKNASYETNTLDCLTELMATKDKGFQASIAVTNKYKDQFKFAADLQEKLSDKSSIENAEASSAQGDFNEAYETLNKRIIERGYSDVLSKSADTVNAALMLKKYSISSKNLSITEAAREFSRIEVNTAIFFNKSPKYKKWLKKQQKLISKRVSKDNKLLSESYSHYCDTLSISEPELLESILLQKAIIDKTSLITNLKLKTNDELLKELMSSGSKAYINKNLSISSKPAKKILQPTSFNDRLANIQNSAASGQSISSVNSLQQLSKEISVDKNFRKQVIKSLLESKGWNNASLINGNMLDISYLLETFYMAND